MPKPTKSPRAPTRILFVCLGNICRSPLAEYVVRERAIALGVDESFRFASAGTGDWHTGNPADARMLNTALMRGVDMSAHRAMQVTRSNVGQWDWLVAMDEHNRRDLLDMGASEERIIMMRQFEMAGKEQYPCPAVPDPYYGGEQGFETVFDIVLSNAGPLLTHLNEHG